MSFDRIAVLDFGGQDLENEAFGSAARGFLRRHMKVTVQGELSRSLVELLNSGSALAMLFVGGYLVMTGTWGLTIGGLSAFTLAAAMTYTPLKKISRGWPTLMESLASAERFFAILDEECIAASILGAQISVAADRVDRRQHRLLDFDGRESWRNSNRRRTPWNPGHVQVRGLNHVNDGAWLVHLLDSA